MVQHKVDISTARCERMQMRRMQMEEVHNVT